MDRSRFAASSIGDLVRLAGTDGRTGESYSLDAFVPHPLVNPPTLSTDTWNAVTAASRALGRLQQGSRVLVNARMLRRPTIRREAQSTSALEGTYAPLDEVLAADVIDQANRSLALREVLNFVDAAERAFDWIDNGRPLTTGLLCELHGTLVRGTASQAEEAGRIRRVPVMIGTRGGSVHDARFVPMPPGPALEANLGDLLDWMRPEGHEHVDPIVAAAMAHYQFETLHPFHDGNGRIGRLLIVAQLVADGVLPEGLLSVSPWFERRRDQYQDLLADVSASGDWDAWTRFFAQGVEASAIDTALRISDLLATQADYGERIRNSGAKGLIRDIADLLIGSPFVTIPTLAAATGKTYQAVSVAVGKLVELGILEEIGSSGVRRFRAPAVFKVLTAQDFGR